MVNFRITQTIIFDVGVEAFSQMDETSSRYTLPTSPVVFSLDTVYECESDCQLVLDYEYKYKLWYNGTLTHTRSGRE